MNIDIGHQSNQHQSDDQTKKLRSLFGEFTPPEGFIPLLSLDQHEEESFEHLVEGLLYEKGYALLSGEKASYKSWLAAYITICVATGTPCFGRKVKQGKVVFVYSEGKMIFRLKRLCQALGYEGIPDNIYPYYLRADLTNKEAVEDLKHHVPEGTALVVFDNYEKFWFSNVDDVVVNKAVQLMSDFREHTAVLLVQHHAKSTNNKSFYKSIGSVKIPNFADSTLTLTRKKNIVDCEIYMRDDDVEEKLSFKLIKNEDGSFTCREVDAQDTLKEDNEDRNKTRLEKVKLLLAAHLREPMSKSNIYGKILKGNQIHGLSTETFFSTVFKQLIDEGFLVKLSEGKDLYELKQ